MSDISEEDEYLVYTDDDEYHHNYSKCWGRINLFVLGTTAMFDITLLVASF